MPLPLVCNIPDDKCAYEVYVYTGSKKNAETESNVFIEVYGEDDDSGVRQLDDGTRKVLHYVIDRLQKKLWC